MTKRQAAEALRKLEKTLSTASVTYHRAQLRQLADELAPPPPKTKEKKPMPPDDTKQIRIAIEKSGLTQATISERLGIPQSALSKFLTGYPMGAKRKARLMEWAAEVLGGK